MLRLKLKSGKSFNFTTKAVNADPLVVFHRDVEKARKKLAGGVMQEKPRFAIALAGVGGCLCIAAGIVVTAPRESASPGAQLPVARAERLPGLPMPSWSDVAAPVVSATRGASGVQRPGGAASDATCLRVARGASGDCRAGRPIVSRSGGECRTCVLNRQSSIVNPYSRAGLSNPPTPQVRTSPRPAAAIAAPSPARWSPPARTSAAGSGPSGARSNACSRHLPIRVISSIRNLQSAICNST